MPAHPRFLLSCLCAIALPALLAAAEPTPAPPAEPKPAVAPAADQPLVLPKLEVTAQRTKQIDKDLKRLDKMINRERKKVKATDLDKALNNEKVSSAAAIFGGNSATHLSAVAASRVMLMEQERMVLEAMKRPATLEERAMMDAEIEQLRLTRRNLDDPAAQR
ncbi:hypothetical protein Verru16b_03364 [Lacunisphaera limnophila]|uniref:LTXXQ motif protein n=1 Tax=Lacunisphaera limnophila TaxID=1838286 RepID=A0A1D8AZH5_9BACT|nr:hypothetical protein [Lacunisphaera limnophila]AOS46264.1 hypothetical protein Verru16b_03364 [Lacunisphaera limnophila]